MDCDRDKEKHSYHLNVTEVTDGEIQEVINFNFGCHHNLAEIAKHAAESGNLSEKHAKQLVLGLRLTHHALKEYPDNELFASFLEQLNDFKHALKGCGCAE